MSALPPRRGARLRRLALTLLGALLGGAVGGACGWGMAMLAMVTAPLDRNGEALVLALIDLSVMTSLGLVVGGLAGRRHGGGHE